MRAVQIKSFGGNEVLEINDDLIVPAPGENQTLVKVFAASINPFDIAMRNGALQNKLNLPLILGGDFAGVDSKTRDEIYGQALVLSGGSGAFAELTVANIANISKKPANISFEEAAALPLVGSSAVQALIDHIKLQSDQKILIHGGAGGIGHIAIQLAKALGAYVTTTVSTDDMGFAGKLGADMVIDYKNQAFENIIKDYDAVYDTVGGQVVDKSFTVLKRGGILVSMLGVPHQNLADKYGVIAIGQNTKTNTEHLDLLRGFVEKGKIKVHIDRVFPIENVKEAFEYQEKAHPRGKVVLKVKGGENYK